jgi:hypothetical protein
MQTAGERRHTVEPKQDLVEQMGTTLGEGYPQQNRPAVFRRGQRNKTDSLGQFFGLVDDAAESGPDGHKVYLTTEFTRL